MCDLFVTSSVDMFEAAIRVKSSPSKRHIVSGGALNFTHALTRIKSMYIDKIVIKDKIKRKY